MKNKDLLAAANERFKRMNGEDEEVCGGKWNLVLIWAIAAIFLFIFLKHKFGG